VTDAIAGWKWVITKLSNGFYTIKNVAYGTYASVRLADVGIKAIERESYWGIHKTQNENEYLYVRSLHQRVPGMCSTCLSRFFLSGSITSIDGKFHWELTSPQLDTEVRR
jgi:hypothetical protein